MTPTTPRDPPPRSGEGDRRRRWRGNPELRACGCPLHHASRGPLPRRSATGEDQAAWSRPHSPRESFPYFSSMRSAHSGHSRLGEIDTGRNGRHAPSSRRIQDDAEASARSARRAPWPSRYARFSRGLGQAPRRLTCFSFLVSRDPRTTSRDCSSTRIYHHTGTNDGHAFRFAHPQSARQYRSNPRFSSQSVIRRSYSNCSHSAVWT